MKLETVSTQSVTVAGSSQSSLLSSSPPPSSPSLVQPEPEHSPLVHSGPLQVVSEQDGPVHDPAPPGAGQSDPVQPMDKQLGPEHIPPEPQSGPIQPKVRHPNKPEQCPFEQPGPMQPIRVHEEPVHFPVELSQSSPKQPMEEQSRPVQDPSWQSGPLHCPLVETGQGEDECEGEMVEVTTVVPAVPVVV